MLTVSKHAIIALILFSLCEGKGLTNIDSYGLHCVFTIAAQVHEQNVVNHSKLRLWVIVPASGPPMADPRAMQDSCAVANKAYVWSSSSS